MNEHFRLERFALRNINYLDHMVDAAGLPYFNVFLTRPAESVHDWPDYGDVNSRQLEAAILIRRMTGRSVATENLMKGNLTRYLDVPGDGLLWRPETPWTHFCADMGDNSLTLCALNALYMDEPSGENRRRLLRMVQRLAEIITHREGYAFFPGGKLYPEGRWDGAAQSPTGHLELMWIRPLAQAGACTGEALPMELAGKLAKSILDKTALFAPEGSFTGHVHSHLRALAGISDVGAKTGNRAMTELAAAGLDFISRQGTSFGFIPELSERQDDVIGCETCALMDYLDLALVLARDGFPHYYDLVERVTRNHLAESQATDLDWLEEDNSRPDTEQSTWRHLKSRLLGSYAGWSAPNQFLAYEEELPVRHWTKDESQHPMYGGKTRLLQNCCGGSGTKGFYQVWENAAEVVAGTLWVHMHFDRDLTTASIRCDQPSAGVLRVYPERSGAVRLRLPSFSPPADIRLSVNGHLSIWRQDGLYACLDHVAGGSQIVMEYPLPVWTESITVGNAGFQQHPYEVTWKGSTVAKITGRSPHRRGYSALTGRDVPLYYGADGPAPLYRREWILEEATTPIPDNIAFVKDSPIRLYG